MKSDCVVIVRFHADEPPSCENDSRHVCRSPGAAYTGSGWQAISAVPFGQAARAVAEYLGTEHHEIVPTPEDLEAALDEAVTVIEHFDPALGSNTVEVTLSAALDSIGAAVSFDGVRQSDSTEGANSATATNVGTADATVDVTTVADNDWCVDVVASSDTAISVGSGQTSRSNVTGALGSGAMSTEGPKSPAGAVTMSWADVGALATWSIVSVALRPVVAAVGAGVPLRLHPTVAEPEALAPPVFPPEEGA